MKVKNFGIWLRYDSRSGTHNMYKEFRELSRADAVKSLYQDMAARHRARFRSIHVRPKISFLRENTNRQWVDVFRSSGLLRSLSRRMSVAHTSNNCLPQVSVSLYPTVCRRAAAPSSPTGPTPSTRLCSLGGAGCRKRDPVLGTVDCVTVLLYPYTIGFCNLHTFGLRSNIFSKTLGQHTVRILDIREIHILIHVYWVDKLFRFSGLIRRTWYLIWPSSRNKTMTLDPPSSQCSSLLSLGHFHARTDAVSSFFLTLLRSDTPRMVSFSFTGIIGTCWKSFTP